MNNEQIIELVEKWLADNSSVTVKELDAAAYAAAATAADAAWAVAADYAAWAAADAAWAVAADYADAASAATRVAKHVARYHELTK